MVIVIDNYDSFVYNLAQCLGELGWESLVHRNDQITLGEIENLDPSHIIISPGPCTPLEAGISNDIIRRFSGQIPILGVCLGHQCIGYVYGGQIVPAAVPTHGKSSLVYHDGQTVYKDLPNPFEAGRYHSLVAKWDTFPSMLKLTAATSDGVIMGIRHQDYVVEGLQFHPESIMTDVGHAVLRNFLNFSQPRWPKGANL
ncbi:MAG: anthranilate/aminodeoxychorismate synthase component II [Dehalococcoidales bacterium]|jgi:anthranilate synthase/aminodeoxychorismate synthase-like glutamine amidotransferase|nr:anthranilate/aminodeoxychorismate synthase component II [Dehalococcoidales bacterium]|tara:strand:- start:3387 stop:3983 length:597 start_codon:yes stop_codon:yes gene_type:complete